MIELPWILKRLPQALPIFDVTRVVADARVENIIHWMTSKEEIADYSDDLAVGGLGPQPAQVCDGVDHLLFPFHHIFEAVKWELMLLKKASNLPLVLLDEGNYALPEVFRDVLCLILRSSLHFSLLFGLLGNFLCFDSLYFLRVLFDAKNMLLGLLGKLQVCDVLGLWRDVLLQVFLILAASLILKCREIHDMKILKRLRCE